MASKQMKKFVVVEFLDEKKNGSCAMDVLCSSWLVNEDITYWPSHLKSSAIAKAAREGKLIPDSSWTQLKIRVLHQNGNCYYLQFCFACVITLCVSTCILS